MKNPRTAKILKYAISFGVSLILLAVYFFIRVKPADLAGTPAVTLYLNLCDGCTIPGVLFLMLGLLVTLSNEGALDGLGYVASFALRKLVPGMGGAEDETYADYLERKRENRVKGYGFLYVTGLVFLALAGIFMALFYSVY